MLWKVTPAAGASGGPLTLSPRKARRHASGRHQPLAKTRVQCWSKTGSAASRDEGDGEALRQLLGRCHAALWPQLAAPQLSPHRVPPEGDMENSSLEPASAQPR